MNIYIGDGLECGGHSREEISKQDLILCEIIKILVNFTPCQGGSKPEQSTFSFSALYITLVLLSTIQGAEPCSSLYTHPPPIPG